MSTETLETIDEIYIPDDSEIETGGGSKSWRLARGKFVRGEETPENSGKYPEERTSFTGLITRVGIQEGSYIKDTKSGSKVSRPIHRLEFEIKTRDGHETVAWSLLNTDDELEPKTGTVRIAWALSQFAGNSITVDGKPYTLHPNVVVKLESWQGDDWEDDKGKSRSGSTYISVYAVTPILNADRTPVYDGNGKPRQNVTKLQRPKVEDGSSRLDQWNQLVPALKALPTYKVREMKAGGGGTSSATHLAELCKEVEAKGWPTPEQAPAEWLTMAAKYFGHEAKATLGSYGDDEWGEVRQALRSATTMPAALDAAATKLKGKGNASAFG